jgi:LysR family transcriptional activator of nhaA
MNQWINYHHLNYFRIIAIEGSISKASAKLKIGQPALSAQLKIFEETIGVTLFERKHKKLILTEAGAIALDYANEIFKMGGELIEVLHDRVIPARPHIQIGALDSVPKNILFSLSKKAQSIARCTITLLEGSMEELVIEMQRHKIDLIVSNYLPRQSDEKKIFSKHIARLPISIYGGKKYLKLKKNFPQSLHDRPFVIPTNHSKLNFDLHSYFKQNGISVDIIAETQDTSLQKIFGVENMALIPLPEYVAESYLDKGLLYKLGKIPDLYEDIYLISNSRKIENPISLELMKSFKLD